MHRESLRDSFGGVTRGIGGLIVFVKRLLSFFLLGHSIAVRQCDESFVGDEHAADNRFESLANFGAEAEGIHFEDYAIGLECNRDIAHRNEVVEAFGDATLIEKYVEWRLRRYRLRCIEVAAQGASKLRRAMTKSEESLNRTERINRDVE